MNPRYMTSALKTRLKELSKDEGAFEQLLQMVHDLEEEKNQSERRLSLLERATGHDYDSILITELSLEKPGPKIIYVNSNFTEITGYEPEEVIGKTPRILQGPKTDREVMERMKERLKTDVPFSDRPLITVKTGPNLLINGMSTR